MVTPGPTWDAGVHRAYLALLLAVLDGDCDQRVHELLCREEDPHFAIRVAHHFAHRFVRIVHAVDHEEPCEMRDDIAAELLDLAGE